MSSDYRVISKSNFLKLNKAMAIRLLLDCAQQLERSWPDADLWLRFRCLLEWSLEHRSDVSEVFRSRSHLWSSKDLTHQQLSALLVPIEREYARDTYDSDFLVTSKDRDHGLRRWPLCLICDNIRSAANLGSMLRTSECYGFEKIFLCGYSAPADHPKVKKASMGTEALLDWQYINQARKAISELQADGYQIVALETASHAKSIYEIKWSDRIAILVGNERHGINLELLSLVDETAYIPLYGRKNSLNVANALAIAASEVVRQLSLR